MACSDERAQPFGEDVGGEAKVDESRPRDLGRTDSRSQVVEPLDDRRRDVARLFAERLGEHHREIGGPVAERRIARPLDHWLDVLGCAEGPHGANELGAERLSRVHQPSEPPLEPGFLGELELDESGLLVELVPPDLSLLDSVRLGSEPLDEADSAFDSPAFDSPAFDSPAFDSPAFDSGLVSLFPPPSPDDSLDAFSLGFPPPSFRCAFRP